ncbi:helix-turn-helix domain-containing protein [Pseudorhodoferax soli]|uniref:Cytoskeleton protein RodZ n=1 Tax=Pseudorhodoferax soli TaxID=545864 RepID=A0A368Y7W4_9BURK|nr:helix-turn-helix domain-containing protein [Pseudorhodoferax soli]RCW75789.1 cytoskeleton protein RodZ [Pseudorhodoferax soli]
MSDKNLSPDVASPPSDQATSGAQRAGAMLRQAREDAGLHVEALAVALKVTVKKLEALEAGRIDLLPDPTFARGLAASICRGLKLDPKPVLDLMPGIAGERREVAPPAINARFEPGAAASGSSALRSSPSPAMWIVAVLLLGALAIYLWPGMGGSPADADNGSAATPMGAPSTVTESVTPAEPAPAAAPTVVEPAPVAPAPAAVAEPAPLLQFVAKSETWVQVTDATGATPLRRSLVAGETVTAAGTPPLNVVVGRIDAVEVQVRGEPRDLRTIAKNNVARFEVK